MLRSCTVASATGHACWPELDADAMSQPSVTVPASLLAPSTLYVVSRVAFRSASPAGPAATCAGGWVGGSSPASAAIQTAGAGEDPPIAIITPLSVTRVAWYGRPHRCLLLLDTDAFSSVL